MRKALPSLDQPRQLRIPAPRMRLRHRLGAALLALASLALAPNPALAEARAVELASLIPSVDHRRATSVILGLMARYHYKQVALDDALSEKIFDRYLEILDRQKTFFLATDIAEFEGLRHRFDDALRQAQLEPAFTIFRRFRQRADERSAFAIKALGQKFDFERKESYQFNREDADWAASVTDLDEIWRKQVKNDILGQKLAERTDEEMQKTLRQRYTRMALRVRQLVANDVYQYFVNAYTLSIEPHTSYFSPRSSENFKIRMSLSLEGIGAALNTEDEYTVVRRIIAGGPAALSEQLQVEDRIVGVGQGEEEPIVDVVSWRLEDVVDLIRGSKGSTVRLRILPAKAPSGSPTKTIALVRDKINLEEQAAKSQVVEIKLARRSAKIGVVTIPTFYLDVAARASGASDYRSTTRDVRRLLDELSGQNVDGVIIDLRGNSGGSLLEAIQLTGSFIRSGPVVQIKDASGRLEINKDPDPDVAYSGPLAVLVDRGSASASEIFAAAIQDYARGVILGEPTYGKGTVQNVVGLDRKGQLGQLKVTIAQFFRVNGEGTQHRGVVPDIVFPTAIDSDAQGERALENALPWAEVSPASFTAWSNTTPQYDVARDRHHSRAKADARFQLLLEELSARRIIRKQRTVSLVEAERKIEWAERETDRERREKLLRKAFGGGSDSSDDDVPDVVLEEAAQVLGDLIDTDS